MLLEAAVDKPFVHRFGQYSLNTRTKVLSRDGEPLHLGRKVVETLLVLAAAEGQIVTKEELMSSVWPGRVMDDANLTQNIALARKTLGTRPGEPGHIETFSGRGYRLIGPVEVLSDLPPAAGPGPRVRRRSIIAVAGVVAVLLVVTVVALRLKRHPSTDVPHIVPVTRLAGKEFQPSIAADGCAVAFLWESAPGNPAEVWAQSCEQASAVRISSGERPCDSPAWSPDGSRVAYLRLGGGSGELVIKPAGGGSETVVANVYPTRHGVSHRHLDWSPDGRWIAVDDAVLPNEPFGIFLVSVTSGEKRRLTQPEPYTIGDVSPRFSPDGRVLSFIRVFHRSAQEVFTVPAAGGTVRQVTVESKRVSDHDWAPDGKTLVFASNRTGEFRLWATRWDGTRSRGEAPRHGDLRRLPHSVFPCPPQRGSGLLRFAE